jgi:hypothetical protein
MNANLSPESPQPKPEPGGIPFPVALAVLLVLLVLVVAAIVGFWRYAHSDKLKADRQTQAAQAKKVKDELADKQATQNARLALAQTHQTELLATTRAATNLLGRVLVEVTRLANDAASLRTNAPGRQVALFPALVAQARHYYDSDLRELAARETVVTKLEGARLIELQLVNASGTTYEPTPEEKSAVQGFKSWGEPALQKAAQLRSALTVLVSDSKVRVTEATVTPDSPTLETAMTKLDETEIAATQRNAAQKLDEAKLEAAKIEAEAKAKEIIAAAERDADEIRAKAKAAADQQARDLALRAAESKVKDAETQVAVQTAEDQKQKTLLRKKAEDPQIQAKLAPFITPGYMQLYQRSIDKKPLSYKEMKTFGALNPDANGLDRLVAIALSGNDRVRSRWNLNRKFYSLHPNDLEQVKEAQQLLVELGPVLVEMGLLQP